MMGRRDGRRRKANDDEEAAAAGKTTTTMRGESEAEESDARTLLVDRNSASLHVQLLQRRRFY